MKDFWKTNYVLGIQIIFNRKNKSITLFQTSYAEKILSRFNMKDIKKGFLITL